MGAQAKRRKIQVCLAWPARMVRREIECGSFLQKNKPGRIPFRFPKGECLAARSCLLKAVASGEWGEGKKQIPPDKTRDSRASSGARHRHLRQRLRRLPRTRAETVKQIPHRRSPKTGDRVRDDKKKTTGSRRKPADGHRNPSPRTPACPMACCQVPE